MNLSEIDLLKKMYIIIQKRYFMFIGRRREINELKTMLETSNFNLWASSCRENDDNT